MTDQTEANAAEKKRRTVAEKGYLIEGEEKPARHASPEATALIFKFPETDDEYVIKLDEIGADCLKAATLHGLAQKLGDAYAGKSGEDAIEAFETVLERLKANDWVKPSEGPGTRPSLVADAIRAALVEHGETVDDDRYQEIIEKVKGSEARKKALANPIFAAHYERIKAERAAAKAAKMAEKAKAAPADVTAAGF